MTESVLPKYEGRSCFSCPIPYCSEGKNGFSMNGNTNYSMLSLLRNCAKMEEDTGLHLGGYKEKQDQLRQTLDSKLARSEAKLFLASQVCTCDAFSVHRVTPPDSTQAQREMTLCDKERELRALEAALQNRERALGMKDKLIKEREESLKVHALLEREDKVVNREIEVTIREAAVRKVECKPTIKCGLLTETLNPKKRRSSIASKTISHASNSSSKQRSGITKASKTSSKQRSGITKSRNIPSFRLPSSSESDSSDSYLSSHHQRPSLLRKKEPAKDGSSSSSESEEEVLTLSVRTQGHVYSPDDGCPEINGVRLTLAFSSQESKHS